MADDDNTPPAIDDGAQTELEMYHPGFTPQDSAGASFNNYQQMGLPAPQTTQEESQPAIPVPGDNQQVASGQPTNGSFPPSDDSGGVDEATRQQGAINTGTDPNSVGDPMDSQGQSVQGPQNGLMRMLAGEGAVDPGKLQQINEQARRGLHDTPADAGVYAIHDAVSKHGVEAGAALVQANRLNYDTANATALKALTGTAQKAPDLKRAIDEANRAQTYMPDGSNVIFSPNGNHGVIAVVQIPGSKHTVQYNLDIPQFKQFLDVGKDGQFDKVFNSGVAGSLQRLAGATQGAGEDEEEGKGSSGFGAFPSRQGLRQAARDVAREGGELPATSGDVQFKRGLGYDDQPQTRQARKDLLQRGGGSQPLRNGEGNTVGAKNPEDADETPSQGRPRPINQRGAGDGQDKDIADATRRAYKLFPWMSQARQRAAFIQNEINSRASEDAKLEQERVKGVNMTDRQRLANEGRIQYGQNANQSRENIAASRDATWRYSTDQKRQAAADRLKFLYDQENKRAGNSARAQEQKILLGKINSGTLTPEDNERLKKYGVAADQTFDAGGGNAPQAATPQANKPTKGQVSLPPMNARVPGETRATDHQGRPIIWQADGWHLAGQ